MGLLTLSELRDELQIALKQRNDLTDAQLNRWINQGYTWVCTPEVRRHEELKSTYDVALVTGTNVYSLSQATVGYHILGISDVTYYASATVVNTAERHDVRPRDTRWFNDHRIPSAGGGPRHYAWRAAGIVFSPIPTSAENGHQVRLETWREPVLLSNDADVTVLTNYWDEAVILAAQFIAEYRLGYRELSTATRQTAVGYVNEKSAGNELQADDSYFEAEREFESYQ
jgi:hypothetical protein